MREAQAAARLNHPAIVTLYELGEHDGHAVLVSELVPGETLAELEAAGDLCDRDVAEIVADLCEALVHAHDRGVVHRDIKPENVIVRELGGIGRRAKLMDFGIARIAGAPTLTAHGEVVGTLAYMSPEQAEGEIAGPPSDIYSLALTAYECWAGANPVAGHDPGRDRAADRRARRAAALMPSRPARGPRRHDRRLPRPRARSCARRRSSCATASSPSCPTSTRCTRCPARDEAAAGAAPRRPVATAKLAMLAAAVADPRR